MKSFFATLLPLSLALLDGSSFSMSVMMNLTSMSWECLDEFLGAIDSSPCLNKTQPLSPLCLHLPRIKFCFLDKMVHFNFVGNVQYKELYEFGCTILRTS